MQRPHRVVHRWLWPVLILLTLFLFLLGLANRNSPPRMEALPEMVRPGMESRG